MFASALAFAMLVATMAPNAEGAESHRAPWLADVEPGDPEPAPEPAALDTPHCPANMIYVRGDYCPLVEQVCLSWLPEPTETQQLRCVEFGYGTKCSQKTHKKSVCVDKYEAPNKAGEIPVVGVTWYQAMDACKAQGKRLCTASEWTLACEGPERLPYPYGYTRQPAACPIDKERRIADEKALMDPATRAAEMKRLDQRTPSGSYASCMTPYGVHDMTGSVDEWVMNETGKPYQSASKGGYWGPVRTRCRPTTVAHFELFSFYQLGYRCCADPR